MENDGSVLVFGSQNISAFIGRQFGPLSALFPPDLVRALYPGLSDPQVIAAAERDIVLHWYVIPFFRAEKVQQLKTVTRKKSRKTME
jgi:hypothetical protein